MNNFLENPNSRNIKDIGVSKIIKKENWNWRSGWPQCAKKPKEKEDSPEKQSVLKLATFSIEIRKRMEMKLSGGVPIQNGVKKR